MTLILGALHLFSLIIIAQAAISSSSSASSSVVVGGGTAGDGATINNPSPPCAQTDDNVVVADQAAADSQVMTLPDGGNCNLTVEALNCEMLEGGVRTSFKVRCTWHDRSPIVNEAYWINYWYLQTTYYDDDYSSSSSIDDNDPFDHSASGFSPNSAALSSSSSHHSCSSVGQMNMLLTKNQFIEFDAVAGAKYKVAVFGMFRSYSNNRNDQPYVNCLSQNEVDMTVPAPVATIVGAVIGSVFLVIIIVLLIIVFSGTVREKVINCCGKQCCKKQYDQANSGRQPSPPSTPSQPVPTSVPPPSTSRPGTSENPSEDQTRL